MQAATTDVSQPPELEQTMEHLIQLIHRPSITPNDAGCQQYMTRVLSRMGFDCETFEVEGVSNLIAKIGRGTTRIAFAGHTDVVPAPHPESWASNPFELTASGDKLIGRGIADMKGGIAAMLTAFELALPHLNLRKFSFYFLITSDEEGEAEFGTKEIIEKLIDRNEVPHYCIVGEPSSHEQVGDVLKIGRRGSISGEVTINGVQGHVAYPSESSNAVHVAMSLGRWLSELSWDEGSKDFPGTHLQVTAINSESWTDNIIPAICSLRFNIRYSHKQTEQGITERINSGLVQLKQLAKNIEINWSRPCLPYYTSTDQTENTAQSRLIRDTKGVIDIDLIAEAERSIFNELKLFPRLSVAGGTSDGRFISAAGSQVIELGLPNHSIHKVNEHVTKQDVTDLTRVYKNLLIQLMSN